MFKFRLEPVLNHRKAVEEQLKKDVAICKALLDHEKMRLESYTTSRHKLMGELRSKQKEQISISETLLYVSFIEQLTRNIELQRQKVLEAEDTLGRKRECLVEAMKKKKSLEKLKDNSWNIYKKKVSKDDQDFLNEVGIYRFNAR